MSKHAAPRSGSPWKPLAAAVAGGAVLIASGSGVWAGLSARTSSAAQSTTSGALSLTMAPNGVGFTQPVSALAPGDTVHRYLTLTQAGTIAGQQLTLGLASSTSTLLTGTDAKSLRLSVVSCSGTWSPTSGACTGTATSLVAPTTTVASALAAPLPLVPGAVAAGSTTALRVSLLLPDNDEVTTNGIAPTNTVQGLSTTLTWTFTVQQRTATTTST